MKTKFYIPILAGTLMFSGCSKDFLQKEPTEFATKQQIDEASKKRPEIQAGTLRGLYSLMYTAFSGGTTNHTDFGHKGNDVFSDMISGDMILAGYTYGWYQDVVE
ncbi:MAG: RagB/SusD family nutrient uptake outer membrane protein, partial [Salegentibacter sp.]